MWQRQTLSSRAQIGFDRPAAVRGRQSRTDRVTNPQVIVNA